MQIELQFSDLMSLSDPIRTRLEKSLKVDSVPVRAVIIIDTEGEVAIPHLRIEYYRAADNEWLAITSLDILPEELDVLSAIMSSLKRRME